MTISEIKNLNYNGFRKNRKEIIQCVNHYFKNKGIPYDEIFKELNFIFWGCDISKKAGLEELESEGKYICDSSQYFYVNKKEPKFTFILDCTLNIPEDFVYHDDNDLKFTDIKIKILK